MHKFICPLLIYLSLALNLPHEVSSQSCACGFMDSNQHLWREAVVSMFTQDAGALAAVNADWTIAADDGVLQDTGYYMQYVEANVFQHNDALGLKTSAYPGYGTIKTAEIDSQRDDILYGTFRMRAQVPSVQGTTFGFFTYMGDSQEQDIELLNVDANYYHTVHYTNQPGLDSNGNVDPDAAKTVVLPAATTDFTAFGQHRLDWLPDRTLYYYNGAQTSIITVHVPDTPSYVILNEWSNGDPTWSQGPPTQDAIATIQNVQLYFNSSLVSESVFNAACASAGHPAACVI